MISQTLAGIVFAGVCAAAALAFLSFRAVSEARRAELSRRLGPEDAALHLLRTGRPAIGEGLALAPLRWFDGLRLHSGRTESNAELLIGVLALAGAGVGMLALVVDGAAVWLGLTLALLPLWLLERAGRLRARKVTTQLPDALDLISRALRAGHALPDALRVAAAESRAPIGEELSRTVEEHRLGVELRTALGGLVERVPESFELRLWVGAMLLNRETGGNLIEVLEHLADTVRERVVFEGKVKALTAEVRASAAILASLPFLTAGLLSVMEPGYLFPLVRSSLGHTMLIGGTASLTIGLAAMRRLSHVEM
jgi:tight adherence protein B